MASKTIKLTSKLTGQEYKYEGTDDTHTFNLPYGEYDVEIVESGYKKKTHTINHQGKQTYSYTLSLDKSNPGGEGSTDSDVQVLNLSNAKIMDYKLTINDADSYNIMNSMYKQGNKYFSVNGGPIYKISHPIEGQPAFMLNHPLDPSYLVSGANVRFANTTEKFRGATAPDKRLIQSLNRSQLNINNRYIYTNKQLSNTIAYVVVNGKRYEVTDQTDVGGRTRLTLDNVLPSEINDPIELWGE